MVAKSGKIKCRETTADDLEGTRQAFVDLLQSKYFGKQLVRV